MERDRGELVCEWLKRHIRLQRGENPLSKCKLAEKRAYFIFRKFRGRDVVAPACTILQVR